MASQTLFTISTVVTWDWKTTACAVMLLPCLLTYLITWFKSAARLRSKKDGRAPPIVPYCFPFLGNLIPFSANTPAYVANLTARYGQAVPVRIRLGPVKMNLISDPGQFEQILKSSTKALTTKANILMALENMFGTPAHVIPAYVNDDSGPGLNPHPGSNVKPNNRIFYYQHRTAQRFLGKQAINSMTEQFMTRLGQQLAHHNITHEWTDLPDFYQFFRRRAFCASIEAMYGSQLLALNPTFVDDFWEWDTHAGTLVKGIPRWLAPSAYTARDRLLKAMKKWAKFAHEHSDCTKTETTDPEWEPYWGSKFIKARQVYTSGVELMDADGCASEDLALAFAANANAIPAASWMTIEALRDPDLLKRVRAEVEGAARKSDGPDGERFNITKLCDSTLLQSMYAEVLRTRIAVAATRTPLNTDFKLGQWLFPKGELIVMPSSTSGMNKALWNTGGPGDPHPLNKFWAERFIVYPDDPTSGPMRNPPPRTEKLDGPEFSMKGMSGAWTPYGGGAGMCPGRYFAKQEMIGALALMSTVYEVELKVPVDWEPQPNMDYFLLGGLPVKDRIPFRIRRRMP